MMKSKCLVVLFFLISCSVCSQNIEVLNDKYGFNKFKLGTHINDISQKVKDLDYFDKNPRVSSFRYSGLDISEVFGVRVHGIRLTYFDSKLMSIQIAVSNLNDAYDDDKYLKIDRSLSNVFGNVNFNPTNRDGSILKGHIWDGDDIRLENFQIDYPELEERELERKQGYIQVYSKKIRQERMNSEF
jgi:hypothetical protein